MPDGDPAGVVRKLSEPSDNRASATGTMSGVMDSLRGIAATMPPPSDLGSAALSLITSRPAMTQARSLKMDTGRQVQRLLGGVPDAVSSSDDPFAVNTAINVVGRDD